MNNRRLPVIALQVFALSVMTFICAPVVLLVLSSFNAGELPFPITGFSTRWYQDVLTRPEFLFPIATSLLLCTSVTVVNLILGTMTAIAMCRGRLGSSSLVRSLILLPLLVPTSVFAFCSLSIAAALGMLGSLSAVFLAYLVVTFPIITRVLLGVFQNIDSNIEFAARTSGASPLRAFLETTLPLSKNGVAVAAVMSFVLVFDESVIIIFLGSASTITFPMKLFGYVSEQYDPLASAYGTLAVVITLVGLGTILLISGKEGLNRSLGLTK